MISTQSIRLKEDYQKVLSLEESSTEEALVVYSDLISRAQDSEHFDIQIDCLIRSSRINKRHGAYYKALHQAGTALQLINLHIPNDTFRLAATYKELGAIYADGFNKSSIALNYFFKGLKCNISSLNVNFHNNIGSIYRDMGKYEESLSYLLMGCKMVKKGDEVIHCYLLENIGSIYISIDAFDKAEKTLMDAKAITHTSNEFDYIAGYIDNSLAVLYLKTNREEEAIRLIESSIERAKQRKHTSVYIESLKNKSNYALKIKDDELFIQTINEAITYTREETLSLPHIDCLKLLKDYYWKQDDFQKACIVADQIINANTTIEQTRENNSVVELLEKRESEIMVLENKNRLISRQKEELEQFAYIVAHDLKEPVRIIGSYSNLIKRRYNDKLDVQGGEFLHFILNSAEHMYSMLDDLLQYVTLKTDTQSLDPIEPNTVIKDIMYRLKDKIEETDAIVQVDEQLPPTAIRPIHFSILVENLLKNAIKFRVEGRPLKISIKAFETHEDITFSVSDNGCGIDSKYHQSIFQIFKRLDKEKYSGTGIGLSICKKIVGAYGGNIWVDSRVDEGSTFFFTISK